MLNERSQTQSDTQYLPRKGRGRKQIAGFLQLGVKMRIICKLAEGIFLR